MTGQLTPGVDPRAATSELQRRLGVSWPHIDAARTRSGVWLERLGTELHPLLAPQKDITFVVFGSLARLEFTRGSDIDWTLLVDGYATSEHRDLADRIKGRLKIMGLSPPGAGGAFGHLTFSHDLIHKIGGDDDTNRNTTQRLLLLLESTPVGHRAAYDRVVEQVLTRYIDEDLAPGDTPYRVPRFLHNDIVRYWRTMAVDFAHKRRARGPKGWALRTAKLRMSRKLMYTSGMLGCFSCECLLPSRETSSLPANTEHVVEHLAGLVRTTPLDITAWVALSYFEELRGSAEPLFAAYDEFLAMVDDPDRRESLETLTLDKADDDPVYGTARELGKRFQDALTDIFFTCETPVRDLTRQYGVF